MTLFYCKFDQNSVSKTTFLPKICEILVVNTNIGLAAYSFTNAEIALPTSITVHVYNKPDDEG